MRRTRFFPSGPVHGVVRPPGSKSLTNRAMVCAALAEGSSHLNGVLDSEDTQVMIEAWQQLGLRTDWNRTACELSIEGCGGILPNPTAQLFVGNSGTTIRFLTAALAACRGDFTLDGVARMRERPIGDLLEGLTQLGGHCHSINAQRPDCPPVHIHGDGLQGGTARIAGNISSQFLSGLMMAAPYAKTPVDLHVVGELVSKPYVSMTVAIMKAFGNTVEHKTESEFHIHAPNHYMGIDYSIEPDASAASYFWAAAAITQGTVRVIGLSKEALQGDVAFCEVLEAMGCRVDYGQDWIEVTGSTLCGIDVDMNAISDTVQTLSAVALFAVGPTRIRGVAHNRHKETDRIGDLARELRKLGATVIEYDDGLSIEPGTLQPAEIETYNDHRMAMSLSLVGLAIPDVWIHNPECTAKTYPQYFSDMQKLIETHSAGHI